MTEDLPVGLLGIRSLGVLSWVPNQVMSERVLDRGGRFSPAGIVGVHTLSLLLSSQAAHDRAAGKTISHITRDTRRHLNTRLTRGYSNPRQGGINSVSL